MRRLILIAAIGLALPAMAAEDSAPVAEAAASTQKATTQKPSMENEEAPASAAQPTKAMASDAAAPPTEPEAAGMAETAEAEPAREPVSPDAVARATFATAIEAREPVDSITSLGNDQDRIYYFSEFVGVDGRRLTHRWEFEGEVVAEVPIAVGGPRWRAYSSKNLDESRLGEWTVSVVDESGHVVHTDSFVYEAAPEPEVAAPTTKPGAPKAAAAEPTATPAAPAASPAAPAAAPAEPGAGPASD